MEIARAVLLTPEDTVHIFFLSLTHDREVDRNRLHQVRFIRPRRGGIVFVRHEQRAQAHGAVCCRTVQHLAHEVFFFIRGISQYLGIGGIQAHISNHAKKPALFPFNHDKFASANVLNGVPLVELHFQTTN